MPAETKRQSRMMIKEVAGRNRSRFGDSVARVIDSLTDSWFDQTAPGWSRTKRFFYALTGSLTFGVGLLFSVTTQRSIYFEMDSLFNLVTSIASVVLLLSSLWFAWLVSWKDKEYGPIGLYLSGLALPTMVWFSLAKILIPLW